MFRKGRKQNTMRTIAKTYMFFEDDINEMLNRGWTPKEVFRLGVAAKNNNPIMIDRIREQEEKIERLAALLRIQTHKVFDLEKKKE